MPIGLVIMAVMYMITGILHFIFPKSYLRVTPLFLPYRTFLIYVSGVVEILAGIGLLYSETRNLSIYLITAFLLLFLIVHFNMLRNDKTRAGIPLWLLILRIPIQFVLIWWAWQYFL